MQRFPFREVLLAAALLGTSIPAFGAEAPRRSIRFPAAELPVFGLPGFVEDRPQLRRLPERMKEKLPKAVWDLAQHPSGGRIRFRTDSGHVGLVAQNPHFSNMYHMASVGENGFDVYVNQQYLGSAWPDGTGKIRQEWPIGEPGTLRDVEFYLPLYKGVTIEEVSVDANAKVEAPTPYAIAKPVVYYGSSITQGGCASNAGGSYAAILERKLHADFVNLGFSGSGLGEPALADAILELDPSCIVLDFWGNPSAALFAERLPVFVAKLREKFAQLPILVVTPMYFSKESVDPAVAKEQNEKRAFAQQFVEHRRVAGDAQLHLVDGLKLLGPGQADGLVDGVHPNSLGFYYCAQGLEPVLRRVLRKH